MKSLIIILLLPISFFSQKKINQEKFKDLILNESFLIIDVRTPAEFKDGNIKNSFNVDYFSKYFLENISVLDKQKNILVYCAAGGRSALAASEFKKLGFKKVFDLIGGYDNWKE